MKAEKRAMARDQELKKGNGLASGGMRGKGDRGIALEKRRKRTIGPGNRNTEIK